MSCDAPGKIELVAVPNGDEGEDMMFEPKPNCGRVVPILPMTGNVLFPGTITPIAVTRDTSLRLLRENAETNSVIGVVVQREETSALPPRSKLYDIGTLARVVRVIDMPNGDTLGILHGLDSFKLGRIVSRSPYLHGEQSPADNADCRGVLTPQDIEVGKLLVRKYINYIKSINNKDLNIKVIRELKGPRMQINLVASQIEMDTNSKQQILEMATYADRGAALMAEIESMSSVEVLRKEIQEKTRASMDKQQREYFLNQQMHVIQEELGGSPVDFDTQYLRDRAEHMKWPDYARDHFEREMQKLQRTPTSMPDYVVQYNYLVFMLDLPWDKSGNYNTDLLKARRSMDGQHFGLDKIKDRVLEMMAVLNLTQQRKSPVLCLVGPPGTGKTSLGKSIAHALEREYVRVALGGVHDEAEIRGHRRTYVGAMPGRIINGMVKAGVNNPVFVLDEIDKVQANNFSGDPMAALLEALDPEQNKAFHDNYLDVDYDLSKVLFIATANSLQGIHPALLDRMEIIEVSGYVLEEKLEIAKRFLVPRQLKESGFKRSDYTFTDEVLTHIIENYTRESGVRQLEQQIGKVVRNRAVRHELGEKNVKKVKISELQPVLGLPIHQTERAGSKPAVAVVTGLAWTQTGGTILFIEACTSKGKGNLSMTGNLGDVMKESATLAYEYLKANAQRFDIDPEMFECTNIHIHVPEGATPKDGPSAGITMFTAMVSAFTGRKVRSDFAMSGEITLRGAVTPVGGIREKILAAKRANITHIVLSSENRRDVEDIPQHYLEGVEFYFIDEMSEVLPLVLVD
ncbi:MAG: endopeptidase La [Bacteroidales bacterium]|nr:endopeptidase La [Bacteroidales bacterium]